MHGLPVNNIVLVKVLESQENLTSIELGSLLTESFVLLNVHHQIASLHILHDEIEACVRLEARVERRQEWMALFVRNLIYSLFRASTIGINKGV
jgi:hypothetical protein